MGLLHKWIGENHRTKKVADILVDSVFHGDRYTTVRALGCCDRQGLQVTLKSLDLSTRACHLVCVYVPSLVVVGQSIIWVLDVRRAKRVSVASKLESKCHVSVIASLG